MTQPATQRSSFVITNYNGRQNLERCLPGVIRAAEYRGLCDDIVVVDDCSTDDSLEFLAVHYPQIRVVALTERSSFLGAANAGFRHARHRYVALLSNDMVPEPDFLGILLRHFEDPNVFAAHASLVNPAGHPESARTIGRFLFGNFKILNTAQPDRGLARLLLPEGSDSTFSLYSGACGIFDRDKFRELGGLHPIYYPFYWEDVDLCFRAWRRGWQTICDPRAIVEHHHLELGTIRNNFDRSYVRNIERRNRFLFLWSNIDSPLHLASHVCYLIGNLVAALFLGRVGFYSSLAQAIGLLPQVMEKRRCRGTEKLSDLEIFAQIDAGESASSARDASVGRAPVALAGAGRVAGFGVAPPLSPG